jgi:hypothetical protein
MRAPRKSAQTDAAPGGQAEDVWYFDLLGPNKDTWVWVRVGNDGKVTSRCDRGFAFYLDVLEDAERHGFAGEPRFGPPPAPARPKPR